MRLALVTRRYWPLVGGAEVAMANLAHAFQRQGHETRIITAQWDRSWPTEIHHRGIPVIRLPQPRTRGWGTWRYVQALKRYLVTHRHELDAVLISMLKHDAFAAVAVSVSAVVAPAGDAMLLAVIVQFDFAHAALSSASL